MKHPAWIRFAPFGETCGATWTHPTGVKVVHCGHPTALWPYFIVRADGTTLVHTEPHRHGAPCTFAKLKHAQEHALSLSLQTVA
jgi:hypothetical protein